MTIPQNLGNLEEFTGLKRGLWGIVTFTNHFVYWYVDGSGISARVQWPAACKPHLRHHGCLSISSWKLSLKDVKTACPNFIKDQRDYPMYPMLDPANTQLYCQHFAAFRAQWLVRSYPGATARRSTHSWRAEWIDLRWWKSRGNTIESNSFFFLLWGFWYSVFMYSYFFGGSGF